MFPARSIERSVVALSLALTLLPHVAGADTQWSGWAAFEGRLFPLSPLHEGQHGNDVSVAARPEFYRNWHDGAQSLTLSIFGRADLEDEARTHWDVREAMWRVSGDTWEVRAGAGRVFWGVTESVHLVDIVNSTDLVESADGEEKLGQPMVDVTLLPSLHGTSLGSLDLFVLPFHRQPTYPGKEGRLRGPYPVDRNQATYASADGENAISYAARWANSMGPIDFGLSYFGGTAREPRFALGTDAAGDSVLFPRYDLIDQVGVDLQGTFGGWLLKFEGYSRSGQGSRFAALAGGFEYTFTTIFGTGADLGILSEYLYDERGKALQNPFDNDIFIGSRLAFNNVSGSDALVGVVIDADNGTNGVFAEASSRIGDAFVLELEGRASVGADKNDPLYAFRRDVYVQATVIRYF